VAPEPQDCKGFPQKTVLCYATFRLREVLIYIDQYLGVRVVKAVYGTKSLKGCGASGAKADGP
jgi:hypothetical protein